MATIQPLGHGVWKQHCRQGHTWMRRTLTPRTETCPVCPIMCRKCKEEVPGINFFKAQMRLKTCRNCRKRRATDPPTKPPAARRRIRPGKGVFPMEDMAEDVLGMLADDLALPLWRAVCRKTKRAVRARCKEILSTVLRDTPGRAHLNDHHEVWLASTRNLDPWDPAKAERLLLIPQTVVRPIGHQIDWVIMVIEMYGTFGAMKCHRHYRDLLKKDGPVDYFYDEGDREMIIEPQV